MVLDKASFMCVICIIICVYIVMPLRSCDLLFYSKIVYNIYIWIFKFGKSLGYGLMLKVSHLEYTYVHLGIILCTGFVNNQLIPI